MKKRVVLCIDDDLRDLELAKESLEQAGFEVIAIDDARVGLTLFMTREIDVVLLDYNFPKTDGGIIACEMRRRKPDVPIVMVSSYREAALHAFESADRVLEKPISGMDIAGILTDITDRGFQRQQLA